MGRPCSFASSLDALSGMVLNGFEGFMRQIIGAAVRNNVYRFRQPVGEVNHAPMPSVRRPIAPRLATGIG